MFQHIFEVAVNWFYISWFVNIFRTVLY